MHRIGEFAALSGLSVKTLRYYDEIGLLKPAATAGESGYRFYSEREAARAEKIVALKRLGFSLEEVARVLDGRVPPRSVLEEARRRLVASIEEKRRELADVEGRLEALGRDAGGWVRLERRPRMLVASVRDRVDAYADADELFRELDAAVRAPSRGVVRGTLWHSCGHGSGAQIEAEVFFEVRPGARPRGRARVFELSAVTAACASAGDDDWESAYTALRRWLPEHGYRLAGPKRELAAVDPFTGAPCLDILFPVGEA